MLVIDNYIKDENLLSLIKNDKKLFPESMGFEEGIGSRLNQYHEPGAKVFAPYMFWDGWWKSRADTTAKMIIEAIWKPNMPCSEKDVVGFEYWARTFEVGQNLPPHMDEDTFEYAETKILNGPHWGSVYYPHINTGVEGGFLEIHKTVVPNGTQDGLEGIHLSPIEERERIACTPNRLVMFDAGHTVHGTTPVISGKRSVLVINLWHKDCPPKAISNGSFHYEEPQYKFPDKYKLNVSTPFGVEFYTLEIIGDTAEISEYRDAATTSASRGSSISKDFEYNDNLFVGRFNIIAPMETSVSLEASIDENKIFGKAFVGEHIIVEFEGFKY
jgi:hypothetical protein